MGRVEKAIGALSEEDQKHLMDIKEKTEELIKKYRASHIKSVGFTAGCDHRITKEKFLISINWCFASTGTWIVQKESLEKKYGEEWPLRIIEGDIYRSKRNGASKRNYNKTLINLSEAKKQRLSEVESLAKQLMEDYGVQDMQFGFSYSKRSLGSCGHDKIKLQLDHALTNDWDEIKNTLLHEIAHAVVGREHGRQGHRLLWQQKAKEMGVRWTRRYHK